MSFSHHHDLQTFNKLPTPSPRAAPQTLCLNKRSHFCCSHHQGIATGLQRRQADAEDYDGGEGVVVDESPAVGISMATVEGQVGVGVAREEDGAEVDLEGDRLHAAVHADVPLRCKRHTSKHRHTHTVMRKKNYFLSKNCLFLKKENSFSNVVQL